MKLRNVLDPLSGTTKIRVEEDNDAYLIDEPDFEMISLLDTPIEKIRMMDRSYVDPEVTYKELIPLRPTAYRDFMLYEKHAIDAARGFVKKYKPGLYPIVKSYERIVKKPFPKLKPKSRFYQHPIYYMGNHLNFITDQDELSIPSYTQELDYELEIAALITKPLKNASLQEVTDAIGGFLILNDFSARDVQLDEMDSGFGPMKTKNFGNAISSVVVKKEALINQLDALSVRVIINGDMIVESDTSGKMYTFEEAIAYASWEEQLHPGELFGSGTIPGCTGIENGVMLKKGDTISLEVEGLGILTNKVN
jgi:2-keto-4-pentenoate hydratase/2-oxohepta-3-ene-1,7-dioic acid hydratase (catechol pathway)